MPCYVYGFKFMLKQDLDENLLSPTILDACWVSLCKLLPLHEFGFHHIITYTLGTTSMLVALFFWKGGGGGGLHAHFNGLICKLS
jgi:hypothetical protein